MFFLGLAPQLWTGGGCPWPQDGLLRSRQAELRCLEPRASCPAGSNRPRSLPGQKPGGRCRVGSGIGSVPSLRPEDPTGEKEGRRKGEGRREKGKENQRELGDSEGRALPSADSEPVPGKGTGTCLFSATLKNKSSAC